VSATTRPPRPGEVDGVHYHFVEGERFDAMVRDHEFLEWAEFGGKRYGTPWTSVRGALAEGCTVVLEIEVQGAVQVRARFPSATLVFLRPPDPDALAERLEQRGTDSEDRIAERMRIAEWEMEQAKLFDYEVVNDDIDAAVRRIASILETSAA
jgi:guanylate kinase